MTSVTKPTVFIIEDNVNNHDLFKAAFEAKGFSVIISQNADGDIVGDIAAINPDIISMDLMLGKPNVDLERDGFDTMRVLKADARTRDIPIFVLTSFFAGEKVTLAKELGAVDFISLPGHPIGTVPVFFKKYLQDPKRYHPVHSDFAA